MSSPSPPHQYDPEKLQQVSDQANELQDKMQGNLVKIVQRGEDLQSMEVRASHLQHQAHEFQKKATKLRWQMCFKSWVYTAIIVVFFIVFLIMVIWATGGFN